MPPARLLSAWFPVPAPLRQGYTTSMPLSGESRKEASSTYCAKKLRSSRKGPVRWNKRRCPHFAVLMWCYPTLSKAASRAFAGDCPSHPAPDDCRRHNQHRWFRGPYFLLAASVFFEDGGHAYLRVVTSYKVGICSAALKPSARDALHFHPLRL